MLKGDPNMKCYSTPNVSTSPLATTTHLAVLAVVGEDVLWFLSLRRNQSHLTGSRCRGTSAYWDDHITYSSIMLTSLYQLTHLDPVHGAV